MHFSALYLFISTHCFCSDEDENIANTNQVVGATEHQINNLPVYELKVLS
jgi:hypothetical protein